MAAKASKAPMSLSDITKHLVEKTGLTKKQIDSVGVVLVDLVKQQLKSTGEIKLFRIMKLKRIDVPAKKARRGINPFTKLEQDFPAKPASKKVKILPLKILKDSIK